MELTTLATLFALFFKEMDEIRHASPHTLRAYKNDLEQAFRDYLERPLPPSNELLQIIKGAQIRWHGLRLASRQRKAATMKAFLDWLYQHGFLEAPLNDKIEAPRVPPQVPHFLSVDEVLYLFASVQRMPDHEPKKTSYLSLLYLLYGGGLRISEACHIRWKNIRFNSSEVCILGKGAKERWVALPSKVLQVVEKLPRKGEFIWGPLPLNERVAYGWVRNLGKTAGLKVRLHPHALRHSYATHLMSAGINLRALQELMGHASLTSTEKYMHLSMDQLARTMESFHPFGKSKVKIA